MSNVAVSVLQHGLGLFRSTSEERLQKHGFEIGEEMDCISKSAVLLDEVSEIPHSVHWTQTFLILITASGLSVKNSLYQNGRQSTAALLLAALSSSGSVPSIGFERSCVHCFVSPDTSTAASFCPR